MKPIIVEFAQVGSTLISRCLQFPSERRGSGILASCGGFSIRSETCEQLGSYALFLPGQQDGGDTPASSFDHETEADATSARVAFTSLIRRWNAENAESGKPTQYAGVWVRAKDEMPPAGEVVLTLDVTGRAYQRRLHDGLWRDGLGDIPLESVTHWARITPPAQEKPVTRTETLTWEVVQ